MDKLAEQWVMQAIRSSLPERIPVPFRRVLAARFLAKKNKTAVASLEMVDGLKAMIEVSKWASFDDAWSYRWHEMDGGSLYWDGDKWTRDYDYLINEQVALNL